MNPACSPQAGVGVLTVCALFDVGWGSARGKWTFPYFHGNMGAPWAWGGAGKGSQERLGEKAWDSPPSSGQAEMLPRDPTVGLGR